ncbi:MAG: polymer-forming cytoskeletal protein [Candidatus Zixiibacteriota bacterium]
MRLSGILRFRWSFFVIAVTLLAAACVATASVFKKGDHVDIGKLDIIDDDVYAYGQRVTADGIISGDLSAFAYQVTLTGEVGQSANLFGRTVQMNGKVNGTFRGGAEMLTLAGYVNRSAVLFARDVTTDKGSVVQRDLTVFGDRIELAGTVTGNVYASGEIVQITGVLTGDVKLRASKIIISPPATIGGNLTYISEKPAQIDTTGGVVIAGQTTWNLPEKDDEEKDRGSGLKTLVMKISSLFAAFLFGIIVVAMFRPYAEESVQQLRTRFTASIASGLLGVALLVVSLVVLVFAILSAMAGLILVSGDLAPIGALVMIFSILMLPITSFAGISGAIMFYSGKIVIALVIGYLILARAKPGTSMLSKSAMFLGLAILTALFFVPILGTVVYLAASVIGFGAILLGIKSCRQHHGMPRSDQSQAST